MAVKQLGAFTAASTDTATKAYADHSTMGYCPPSGAWTQPANMANGATGGTGIPASGSVRMLPVDITTDLTFQSIGAWCVSAQSGGTSVISVGIYDDDGTGGAPNLATVMATGTITAAATGVRIATGGTAPTSAAPITLKAGRYWTAFATFNSAAPTTAPAWICVNNAAIGLWVTSGTTFGTTVKGLKTTTTNGTLPTSGTIDISGSTDCPIVALRRA